MILRSTHARARILRVDRTSTPAGAMVFLAEDLPELRHPIPLFREPASNPYCDFIAIPDQFALASDEVRNVGEPIAAILADSLNVALDALDLVAVEYRPLPALLDPERAMSDESERVHGNYPNVVAHLKADIGDAAAAFQAADIVMEERFEVPRRASMPLETRAVCAVPNGPDELTIVVGHQIPGRLDPIAPADSGHCCHDRAHIVKPAMANFLRDQLH